MRITRVICAFLLFLHTATFSWGADKLPEADVMKFWSSMADTGLGQTDPEFNAIYQRLLAEEILPGGTLTDVQKSLVTLVALATKGADTDFVRAAEVALDLGAKPGELREAIYQIAPYVGLAATSAALRNLNMVFEKRNIALPLPAQGTVNDANRFEKGLATQMEIFGKDNIGKMQQNAPAGQKDIVVKYLSAWCFGDFYTRGLLDLKMRELLTFSAIVTLGGCDPQAKAHAAANITVGNSKQNLIDALAVMLPWNGFPRTLNGLAAVNAAVPE